MKRITKYEPSKDSMFPYKLVDNELSTELNAIHQLGRFEDLEEELGCPLVVVFKALKEGIVYEKENKYILIPNLIFAELLNEDVADYHFINYDLPNLENNLIVKLSDYQKTWWLEGEENGK